MSDTHLLDDIDDSTPIGSCLTAWHRLFLGDPGALDEVLADDVVLHSPVLFKPVLGKELVSLYLTGASMTFVSGAGHGAGQGAGHGAGGTSSGDDGWDGRFRYVRVLTEGRDAVLEFETTMGDKYVNGVDMITCDEDGLITDFKVMVRPQQAVEAVREMMASALETLQAGDV